MQVARWQQCHSGERVSNESLMYPGLWDSCPKGQVIPDDITAPHGVVLKGPPVWAQAISYQLVGAGNGPPRRRRVAGLRGWPATLGLRHCPDSYGGLQ